MKLSFGAQCNIIYQPGTRERAEKLGILGPFTDFNARTRNYFVANVYGGKEITLKGAPLDINGKSALCVGVSPDRHPEELDNRLVTVIDGIKVTPVEQLREQVSQVPEWMCERRILSPNQALDYENIVINPVVSATEAPPPNTLPEKVWARVLSRVL